MIRNSLSTLTRAACVALSAAILLAGCGEEKKPAQTAAAADAAKIHVGVVQLVEHEALDATVKGFIDALAERGYKDGEKITIDRQNAQGDQTTLANIGSRFVSDNAKLIFASSTPAVQAMARATKTIPVVATAVTSFEAARVVKSDKEPGGNVTGVSNLGPIAAQMALLVEMTGDATKTGAVGVLYNPSEVNAEYQVEKFRAEAQARGIRLIEGSVSNVNDIPQAMNAMRGKVCAMWLPTDNVLAAGAATVARLARDMKLPVFASDTGSVRNGLLAVISVDYYELGRLTGNLGADILEGKKSPATTPIAFQDAQKPIINLTAAEAIGFRISPEVLERSETIK
ncbi:ABC transporter substrate-binding protein [Sutterella sp.]|uniref:ABC transporter substrate-binding protein n=1 Tax=Sutterella sp. TaxID=1981025 RepID=UPI0026DEE0AD|nr:ABC transporter substrate-binding protein [Sutterella sp.]MDO5531648.1 ABC transporter substrate-binding protein [Sutterella sp.]